jgi:hypothetical protein
MGQQNSTIKFKKKKIKINEGELISDKICIEKIPFNYISPEYKNYIPFEKHPTVSIDSRIRSLRVFIDDWSFETKIIKGIQIVYECRVTMISHSKMIGNFRGIMKKFNFAKGVYIKNMKIRIGWVLDGFILRLSDGTTETFGGNGGSEYDFNLKDSVILGFHGIATSTGEKYIISLAPFIVKEEHYLTIKHKRILYLYLLYSVMKGEGQVSRWRYDQDSPELAIIYLSRLKCIYFYQFVLKYIN